MKIRWSIFLMMTLVLMGVMKSAGAEKTKRPVCQIKAVLVEDEGWNEVPYIQMSMNLTLINESEDVWHEICFRDYMSLVYERHYWNLDTANWHSGVTRAVCDGRELMVCTESAQPLQEGGQGRSVVYVQLHEPLCPGESAVLTLECEADIPPGGMRCSYGQFHVNQEGARTYELTQFFPVLAVYADGRWMTESDSDSEEHPGDRCIDYELCLYVPEGYAVIASGEEKRGVSANGMTEWRIRAENMRDVGVIVSNELMCITDETCGVAVRSWHAGNMPQEASEDHEAQGRAMLEAAMEGIAECIRTGNSYPYDALDVVESDYYYGSVAAPGLIRISQKYSWFMGEDDSAEDRAQATAACKAETVRLVDVSGF